MEGFKLSTNTNINSVSDDVNQYTATGMRIKQVTINVAGENNVGQCSLICEYGTVDENDFTPLPVPDSNKEFTINIDQPTFALLANTPISPYEKAMKPFGIIESRIYNYLKSIGYVTE